MKLDVATLGTIYEMAREGAGIAAGRLTKLTGTPTRVGVTRLNFADRSAVAAALEGDEPTVGTRVSLSGGLEGDVVLVFDRSSARRLADDLLDDVPEAGVDNIAQDALVEVGQMTTSALVDGWADVLGTVIDASTPTYLAGNGAEELLEGAVDDEFVIAFQSRIETVGAGVDVDQYLLPTRESIARLVEQRRTTAEGIPLEKLAGFNRMAERGAAAAADDLGTMTGLALSAEIRRINFLSLDAIPDEIPDRRLVSVAFRFRGSPSGYLLFVFDEPSAVTLIDAAMPGADPDPTGGFDDLARDAIAEFSNVMASGLLDGWANVLDTTIEHTTPRYAHDLGSAVVDPLLIGLCTEQEFAFVFDTVLSDPFREVDVGVYAIPDEAALETALAALDLDRIDTAPTTAELDVGRIERADASDHDDLATPEEVTD